MDYITIFLLFILYNLFLYAIIHEAAKHSRLKRRITKAEFINILALIFLEAVVMFTIFIITTSNIKGVLI